MDWVGVAAIGLCFALATLTWKLNRLYLSNGRIFTGVFDIRRDRSPTLFRWTMAGNWLVFGCVVVASFGLAGAIIAGWMT